MANDFSKLIEDLKRFEEYVISEYCIELGCSSFCNHEDCIVVRAIDALERLVEDGK